MRCVRLDDEMDAENIEQMFDWMGVTADGNRICFDGDEMDDLISEIDVKSSLLESLKRKLEQDDYEDEEEE